MIDRSDERRIEWRRLTMGLPALPAAAGVEFVETHAVLGQRAPVQASVLSSESLVAEEFRYLAARLRTLAAERALGCLGIVSAVQGEGKSTITLGLATALARESRHSVLVVEADLHKPRIESYLGVARSRGVSDWLGGDSRPLPVRIVAPSGFRVLTVGERRLDSNVPARSRRMAALLAAARDAYQHVLVDLPPLTPVADAVEVEDLLDGFLLVVRARHAPRDAILRAAGRLHPESVVGLVMTGAEQVLPARYDDRYRGYGTERAGA